MPNFKLKSFSGETSYNNPGEFSWDNPNGIVLTESAQLKLFLDIGSQAVELATIYKLEPTQQQPKSIQTSPEFTLVAVGS